MTLRLLSYNIRYGGVGHEEALVDVIGSARPDVVLLQEATRREVVARIAERGGFPAWGCQPRQSTGFLSRVPVVRHAWHHPPSARHAFLELVIGGENGWGEVRIFGLHLTAWFSNWSERRRTFEIAALLNAIRHHQHGFHVIAGDFNALAPGARLDVARMPRWIRAMVWLNGRDIARSTIQVMLDASYVDLWRALHPGDPSYTFPVWDPHVRLDYVFTPERHAERVRAVEIVSGAPAVSHASDHLPLLVELD